MKLGAREQPWHPPLVSSICKIRCLKGSLLPADLSKSYAKEVLRLGRESSLARVPVPAATIPATPELSSDARWSSSSRRPRALPPFFLRALAEVLLPGGASSGVQPGDSPGAGGPLGSVRAAWTAGYRRGAGLLDWRRGYPQNLGHRGAARLRGNRLLSLGGQHTCCPSGAEAASCFTGLSLGKGLDAGAGLLLPQSARAGPDWHPTASLGAVPAPAHSLTGKRAWRGVHALVGCPPPPGRGQWVMQVCFRPLGREGSKRLRSFSAPICPLGE